MVRIDILHDGLEMFDEPLPEYHKGLADIPEPGQSGLFPDDEPETDNEERKDRPMAMMVFRVKVVTATGNVILRIPTDTWEKALETGRLYGELVEVKREK